MLMRVKGVNKVRAKGRIYYYHRATGTRLLAEFGTAAFLLEIDRLNGLAAAQPVARAGALGALVTAYRGSPEFAGLAPRTKADYQRVLDFLQPLEEMPVKRIGAPFVIATRDRAYRRHKRRFANYVIDVLSLLFAWGKLRGWVDANPAEGTPKIPRPKDMPPPNRPWKPAELAVVLAAARPGIKAAVALGAYAGLREGDVVRCPWTHYNGTEIEGRQGKTGDLVWMPAHRELRAILDATPRLAVQIVTGERGLPFKENGFRTMFFRLVRELERAGAVGRGLTFHGLRHTIATRIAEVEGTADRDIMAVTGHRSTSSVKPYIESADRRRRARATIEKLERIADEVAKPAAKPPVKARHSARKPLTKLDM
jgi:integrase